MLPGFVSVVIFQSACLESYKEYCYKSGDRIIKNSVLESLIFNLFLIIHTRISEIHMFNLVNDSKGSLHLNEI